MKDFHNADISNDDGARKNLYKMRLLLILAKENQVEQVIANKVFEYISRFPILSEYEFNSKGKDKIAISGPKQIKIYILLLTLANKLIEHKRFSRL